MNTNGKLVDNGRLDLFHECFHYEWHFCFNKLRELHQRDIRQLPQRHLLVNSQDIRGKRRRSPLQWAEWQARRGAFGLLVPRSIMSQKIHEELGKHSGKDWHMGKKLDVTLRTIADDFDMAKGHMRGRAIQLGYIEAKGALNYVDRRYIEPFAFDPENGGGNYTFVHAVWTSKDHKQIRTFSEGKLDIAEKNLSRLESQRKALEHETVESIMGNSRYDFEVLTKLINDNKVALGEAKREVDRLKALDDSNTNVSSSYELEYQQVLNWRDIFDNATVSEKKTILCQLIDRIEVDRNYQITIFLKGTKNDFLVA